MGGTVSERALQLQHHLAGAVTLEPFVGDRRAGDIAVQVLRLRAALEHAEHELLVLAATLAEEDLEVLHGGRIHALEPERHVARADPSDQLLSLAMLVGQEVAKPAGSGKLCHAAPVCPGMPRQSNALRSRRADLAPRRWPSRRAIIEYRYSKGNPKRFTALTAELVSSKVDIIVATSTPAIEAARRATTTIPIVMLSVGDPVSAEFIASLARPGGNITGVTGVVEELSGKLLEVLVDAVPKVTQVGVLWNPVTERLT